mmetsp:Transcript_74730/g.207789  ORF Transcript_74730/g.207789 Transcript_74730/m.207789 type:complete len:355 (-) Transcript_74730:7-1071(-)
MEFPFNLSKAVGAPPDHVGPFVGRLDESTLRSGAGAQLCGVLEAVGKNSAIAQGLRKPVTIGSPGQQGHRVYLLVDGKIALGLLKVGTKNLFVEPPPAPKPSRSRSRDSSLAVRDGLRQISPLCALDFYVHESCQRNGFGRKLFDAMIAAEGARPEQMAYDRPSPKLIAFLRKHFNLTRFQPQNNNFVVFDDYFRSELTAAESRAAGPGAHDGLGCGGVDSGFGGGIRGPRDGGLGGGSPCVGAPYGGGLVGGSPYCGGPCGGNGLGGADHLTLGGARANMSSASLFEARNAATPEPSSQGGSLGTRPPLLPGGAYTSAPGVCEPPRARAGRRAGGPVPVEQDKPPVVQDSSGH